MKIVKLILSIFFPFAALGQNTIGLPDVINYQKSNYSAGLQNWDIRQDNNGIIYVANNEGLLSFDGQYWKIYPLPNKTIVRSVEIGEDNRIYVGGQDELGYFSPGENGRLTYHSLTAFIPEKDRSFGDVWDISSFKRDIFFRTSNKIFKFSGETVAVSVAFSEWSFMGVCKDQLYAHDYRNGLLIYKDNSWLPIPFTNQLPTNDPVTGIINLQNDSTLITTLKNGLFILSKAGYSKIIGGSVGDLEKERIYAATAVNNNWIALATNNGGVYIIDIRGQLIQRFSKAEGLQNNNVLSILLDKQRNLWLGLNNGIDFIAYNSAIKHITPNSQDGPGYTAIIHKNHLYTGTSAGLFSVPLQPVGDLSFSKGSFLPVANTTGQTWGLAEINGKLLLGHHEGAFLVEGNTASHIPGTSGFWNFVPMTSVYPVSKTVAGNYKGLSFFDYRNNSFFASTNIPDFFESCRFVTIDKEDNIWVSHPYHGVYKLSAQQGGQYKTELYTVSNGLPSTLNNHVYKLKNEVVVATERGVYIYNAVKDGFEPSDFYKKLLGSQSLRYLKEDANGNIWFIHDKSIGVLDMSNGKPEIIYLPELTNKILSGFEFIYPVNENNIFIGGENGLILLNYEKYKKTLATLHIQIRSVKIIDKTDSLIFGGYFNNANEKQIQDEKQIRKIANNWKTIHFEYSSPLFGQQGNLQYTFRLKGFNENWAAWSNTTEKEYTNLPPGSYTFEIKVRNNLGNESDLAGFSFIILPPWYQTTWAYFLYFIIFCTVVFLIYRWQIKKFYLQQTRYEEEQKRLQYLHQLEINKAENELVTLRNEKLQAEIDFKNSELANSAMHLVHKGEILTKMKAQLNQVMKLMDNEKSVNELKKLVKVLGEDDRMDKDWEHFATHFDKVHSDFVVSVKERHPTVTGNELKLCAYLRMNLSTKEIAQLMNISVRGVEISRYRLRKKLGISTDMNLFDYLINLG